MGTGFKARYYSTDYFLISLHSAGNIKFLSPQHTYTHTHTHTGRASLVSQHVARTLEILRNQLLHHQFQQAAATMETVAMVMDHVPEIVRKVIVSADVCM